MLKALIVTDPLCSWCWGMSPAVEEAAHELRGLVRFDLLLGGVNVHGTQPIGDFGRRHLMRIWQEVHAVTGQSFGFTLPDPFVYNSILACIAVEAVRRRSDSAPFGFLHRLQQALFVEGQNTNEAAVLDAIATEFGWRSGELTRELDDPTLRRSVVEQIAGSRQYGTNALPNVVIEQGGKRRLLLGGYADSAMLSRLLKDEVARSER
jgi:putative protein-disulfide isomerase